MAATAYKFPATDGQLNRETHKICSAAVLIKARAILVCDQAPQPVLLGGPERREQRAVMPSVCDRLAGLVGDGHGPAVEAVASETAIVRAASVEEGVGSWIV